MTPKKEALMDSKNLEESLIAKLQVLDKDVEGFIRISEKPLFLIKGRIISSVISQEDLQGVLDEATKGLKDIPFISVTVEKKKPLLTVINEDDEEVFSTETEVDDREGAYLDEVKVIYQGSLPVSLIQETENFKKLNFEFQDKLRAVHDAVAFISPLVLDKQLRVIDGNLRLRIAKLNEVEEVPVIVIDADTVKASFLKLLLNRSGEFQRWFFPEVDVLVDSVPQLQPLLEPFGFFSNTILPTSFFADTILRYHIDEFNEQQQEYMQDETLASWAEKRRALAHEREERRKANRAVKRDKSSLKSLFSLEPKEEDFLETNSPREAIDESVRELIDVSAKITEVYDEKRKKEKEEAGEAWQTSRRGTRAKAQDARAEAMRKLKEAEEKAALEGKGKDSE